MTTTALARLGEIIPANAKPIESLATVNETLALLRKEDLAFVLTPLSNITEIRPFHRISLRAVYINPLVTKSGNYWKPGPHCYRSDTFCGSDEVALGKNGLAAILSAAGANPVVHRVDDRSDPLYAYFEGNVFHQDYDGLWRQWPGNKIVDLRDGSPAALAMSAKQLAIARQFVAENAETKAILRAARGIFQIASTYKVKDLERKPFVIPKLVAHWDLSDPDQKRAAIQQQLGATTRLFGGMPQSDIVPPGEPGEAPPPVKEIAKASTAKALPEGKNEAPPPPPVVEEAFDADLDFTEEPVILVCGCPCGHQLEVTPDVAELSVLGTASASAKVAGVIRCAACYPGRGFDYKTHAEIADLEIPKWPGLTAERIHAKWAKQDAAEKKK